MESEGGKEGTVGYDSPPPPPPPPPPPLPLPHRLLLQKARGSAPTARVMMKSAKLEWQLTNTKKATTLLLEAVERHPDFSKVRMYRLSSNMCGDHVTLMSYDVICCSTMCSHVNPLMSCDLV